MGIEKNEIKKNDDQVDEALQNIQKVNKVIIDEKTGTVTLQISKEQGTVNNKKCKAG